MRDTVVFTYARMNPPTKGHTRLVNAVRKTAINKFADHYIGISRAENGVTSGNKNPLSAESKMDYLELAFPHANLVLASKSAPSMMDQLVDMSGRYRKIIVMCGEDRVEEYKRILNDYNGTHFGFESFEVMSVGSRDDNSYSSTHARELAAKGDLRGFFDVTAHFENGHTTVEMYDDVREGLGINTSDEEGTHEKADEESPAEA